MLSGFFLAYIYSMELIFDDNNLHLALAPISLTRPVAEIRFGIWTFAESWRKLLSRQISIDRASYQTEPYLQVKFQQPSSSEFIRVAGNVKADEELVQEIFKLSDGENLFVNDIWIACKGMALTEKKIERKQNVLAIQNCTDLFRFLGEAIEKDFTNCVGCQPNFVLSNTNQARGIENIFLEEGSKANFAFLNAEEGPIYIGKDAEIMEGAMIRGPFVLGEGSVVKMGAKIYGPTSIGPYCKVGGEISNSLFQGYSNKGHDGFLGNSVVGEWCNFGADTNSSNLKNNYGHVKLHSYATRKMEQTDLTFCGVIMGDHSKTGINTMLNTATTVGVSANVFDGGFPPKYIPSFSWGGKGTEKFDFDKACEVATRMMDRRQIEFSIEDKTIFRHLYDQALK